MSALSRRLVSVAGVSVPSMRSIGKLPTFMCRSEAPRGDGRSQQIVDVHDPLPGRSRWGTRRPCRCGLSYRQVRARPRLSVQSRAAAETLRRRRPRRVASSGRLREGGRSQNDTTAAFAAKRTALPPGRAAPCGISSRSAAPGFRGRAAAPGCRPARLPASRPGGRGPPRPPAPRAWDADQRARRQQLLDEVARLLIARRRCPAAIAFMTMSLIRCGDAGVLQTRRR